MESSSSPNELLVVLGATGNQGKAIFRHFQESATWPKMRLRGVTRNVQSNAAKSLEERGVEMVQADLNDFASLRAAFESATHIFATTDSNQLIFNAIKTPELLRDHQTPRSYAQEIEYAQGENIANAASATATLQRLVWSSLPSPKKWSNDRFTKVSMFDTKEDIANMLLSKTQLREKVSVLLVGFYATNALAVPVLYSPQKQPDGSYKLALPMSGDVSVPFADLDSDMGAWTAALFQAPAGISLVGATEILTWRQWLSKWATHNRVRAGFARAAESEYANRIPGISDAVAEEFAFVEEYGYTGGNPDAIYPDDLRRRGIALKTSSIEDHIKGCDWSSIL